MFKQCLCASPSWRPMQPGESSGESSGSSRRLTARPDSRSEQRGRSCRCRLEGEAWSQHTCRRCPPPGTQQGTATAWSAAGAREVASALQTADSIAHPDSLRANTTAPPGDRSRPEARGWVLTRPAPSAANRRARLMNSERAAPPRPESAAPPARADPERGRSEDGDCHVLGALSGQ